MGVASAAQADRRVRARPAPAGRLAGRPLDRPLAGATSPTGSCSRWGASSARSCGSCCSTRRTRAPGRRPCTSATSRRRSCASASCSATRSGWTPSGVILVHNHPSGDPTPEPGRSAPHGGGDRGRPAARRRRARPPRGGARCLGQPPGPGRRRSTARERAGRPAHEGHDRAPRRAGPAAPAGCRDARGTGRGGRLPRRERRPAPTEGAAWASHRGAGILLAPARPSRGRVRPGPPRDRPRPATCRSRPVPDHEVHSVSMLDRLLGLFSRDIGIDLGTANTLVHVRDRGIVIASRRVVAIDAKTEARPRDRRRGEADGRPHARPRSSPIRPLRDGVISDFDVTEQMIKYFVNRVHDRVGLIPRPRMLLGIPSGVTEVEKRAVRDAALNAGARWARLIEEPMAAAIGAGLPGERAVGLAHRRHRRRDDRGGGHLARRDRRRRSHPHRRRRDGPGHRRVRAPRVQPVPRRADGRGHQDRDRVRAIRASGTPSGSRSAAATC